MKYLGGCLYVFTYLYVFSHTLYFAVKVQNVITDLYCKISVCFRSGLTMSSKRHRGRVLSVDNKIVHEGYNR